MAVHLLIDGYNLIRQSSTLRAQDELALELGREALLERLRQYKRVRGHRITVVFDAANKPLPAQERRQEKGIEVIYSGRGESADALIKRICRNEGKDLMVVTADRELANYVETYGAVTMDSEEFDAKMEMTLYLDTKGAEDENEAERWHPSHGTRKKGPARRRSKKERKKQQKMRKL